MVSQRSPPPRRNRELRAVAVANDERAGRVEGDADDFAGVGAGIGERAARRRAGGPPDILGIVLGMSGLRAVHDDRIVSASEQIAAAVEDSGARAARADIDGTDKSAARLARRLAALPCQQVRKIAHVVEDEVGLHRLECPQEAGALGMRAAGEGKDAHPRLLGGGDAGRTVLDHRAVFRRHAHLARHVQEEVGRRLAARHHRGAEDMRLEGTTKAGDFQRQPDALKLARRGHATPAIDTGKRLGYPGDRLEVTAEALEDRRPHAVQMVVGDDQAEFVAQHAVDGRHAAAEKALIGGRLADFAAHLGNQREQHVDRDRLAVHQHAVAIEDDQLRAILRQRATSPSGERWARQQPSFDRDSCNSFRR